MYVIKWLHANRISIKYCLKTLKKWMILLFTCILLSSIFALVLPSLNMQLIDLFVYKKLANSQVIFASIYIVVLISSSLVSYWEQVLNVKIDNKLQFFLNNVIIKHASEKRMQDMSADEAGDVDVLIKSDAVIFQQFMKMGFFNYPFVIIKVIATLGILLWLNVKIAIIVFALATFVNICQNKIGKKLEQQSIDVRNSYVEYCDVLTEITGNVSYLLSAGIYNYLKNKSNNSFLKFADKSLSQNKTMSFMNSFVNTVLSLNIMIVLVIGSYGIYRNSLSIGTLLSLIQYVGVFVASYTSLIEITISFRSVYDKLNNVSKILEKEYLTEGNTAGCTQKKSIAKIEGISLEKLSFSYNEEKIFDNVSVFFEPNKVNCICGSSGSGKTTLLKLILGEYNLKDNGTGKIVGRVSKEKECDLSIENIGYVPQETFVFADTIKNNLTLGEKIDQKRIDKVCKACSIYEDIVNTDQGYETRVNAAISSLSGGQMKRIAIARTLLLNKSVLLLDEPTAGLDDVNASMVFDCIKKIAEGRTIIVISHDKYIEEKSDAIYRIENKKLIAVS